MKLSAVYFDDTVCIPGGKDTGGGVRHDLRESSFHADEGWDIEWDGHVLFTLWRDGMPRPAQVGGYGFTFVAQAAAPAIFAESARGAASGLGVAISDEALGNTEIPAAQLLGEKPKRSRRR